jgi:aryl-alcohol dehydrogenase-like predicted oxidoreductase
MEQRPLGKTGTTVSALGFGCGTAGGLMNKGEPREQRAIVERAIEAGITYFDTAPNYGDGLSETNLGRVIRELGVRDEVLIGTKAGLLERDMANPEAALRSIVEGSLRRLGMHSVDLLFLHTRVQREPDERSMSLHSAEAVADVFDAMRAEGKTALTGFTAHGDTDAIGQLARSGRYHSVQAYFSAANPSAGYAGRGGDEQNFDGVIDIAAAAGSGVINIQPLSAGGLLEQAHPYARDFTHGRLLSKGARLSALAQALGLESVYELALRFALAKTGISCVLVGFSSMEQVDQAIAWSDRGPLPAGAVQQVLDLANVEPHTAATRASE